MLVLWLESFHLILLGGCCFQPGNLLSLSDLAACSLSESVGAWVIDAVCVYHAYGHSEAICVLAEWTLIFAKVRVLAGTGITFAVLVLRKFIWLHELLSLNLWICGGWIVVMLVQWLLHRLHKLLVGRLNHWSLDSTSKLGRPCLSSSHSHTRIRSSRTTTTAHCSLIKSGATSGTCATHTTTETGNNWWLAHS